MRTNPHQEEGSIRFGTAGGESSASVNSHKVAGLLNHLPSSTTNSKLNLMNNNQSALSVQLSNIVRQTTKNLNTGAFMA